MSQGTHQQKHPDIEARIHETEERLYEHYAAARPGAAAPFPRVLCGLDGSGISLEAARQAGVMAGPGASVEFVSVVATGEPRDQHRFDYPMSVAEGLGAESSSQIIESNKPAQIMTERARAADLVVLGDRDLGLPTSILTESVSATVVHRHPTSILVARPMRHGLVFPRRILLASDGSDDSRAGAALVAKIAARHESAVTIMQVRVAAGHVSDSLEEEAALIRETSGTDPELLLKHGPVANAIIKASQEFPLTVVGARGLGGVRALGSVSERVAHGAHSSVLIAGPDAE